VAITLTSAKGFSGVNAGKCNRETSHDLKSSEPRMQKKTISGYSIRARTGHGFLHPYLKPFPAPITSYN
jgi:hypothetical protein